MLQSLKIENFRGFQKFELKQLGRINLIVGTNNSGKTSILEAIQLLCSRFDLDPLSRVMSSRGELVRNEEERVGTRRDIELDIRHLFYGHQILDESEFCISASHISGEDVFTGMVRNIEFLQGEVFANDDVENSLRDLELLLRWKYDAEFEEISIPLSYDSRVSMEDARRSILRSKRNRNVSTKNSIEKVSFISSSSLKVREMVELFDQIVLTPEEDVVIQALRTIDPKIDRIAPLSGSRSFYSERSGFVVKYQNIDFPIPIGNMGDGIWRMLGLAMSVTCVKKGVLLIDEIDTGLHFSTMQSMWRVIFEAAQRLNVQIFATTHSRDCWESLAEIAEEYQDSGEEIIVHRIQPEKKASVEFNSREMMIAFEENIEVR